MAATEEKRRVVTVGDLRQKLAKCDAATPVVVATGNLVLLRLNLQVTDVWEEGLHFKIGVMMGEETVDLSEKEDSAAGQDRDPQA